MQHILRNQRQEKSEFRETEKKNTSWNKFKTKKPHQRTRRKENISSSKIQFYQTPTNATKGQILGLPKKKSVWGCVRAELELK